MIIRKLRVLLFSGLAIVFCFPLASTAQVVINEYSAANWSLKLDDYNKHEDWVELYNAGGADVDLGGYFLTDKANNPGKFKIPTGVVIPSKGRLLVFLSGRNIVGPVFIHTNFKIKQTGKNPDYIGLYDPSQLKVDDITVEATHANESRGRITDGSPDWGIFTNPTPVGVNDLSKSYSTIAKTPKMDKDPGFYSTSVYVNITTSEGDGIIRYTTNGDEPTDTSAIYTDSILITQTTVLKAKVFTTDTTELPSFTEFNTYFIDVNHTLPVVSISGSQLSVLANGDNSLRPTGFFEFFNLDKERKASGGGEFNSHGQDSWANDQRSLDWVSRDEFGYGADLKEKFFSQSTREEFQRLILRAAGDDNYPAANHQQNKGSAHIRDAYVHNLAKKGGLDLDVRLGEKAIVYLNGKYWGVYDLREIPDDHDYTKYYYNQDKYSIQYILTWGNTWVQYGDESQTFTDWYSLYNYIFNNDLSDAAKFEKVAEQYDYKSLVDYVLVNSFTVCTDWLNYNTGWWRGLNPDGGHQKWGYILWDNDATFGHYINYTGVPDQSPQAKPCNVETLTKKWQDPEGHIKILNKLRENPVFDQYYISRQADLMNTVFSCENMLSQLDSIIDILKPEMAQHALRWFGTYNGWFQNALKLRKFIEDRCAYFAEGMIDCYNLTGPYNTVFMVDPPGAGELSINTLGVVSTPYFSDYFGGVDTKLTINPLQGNVYEFDRWESTGQTFLPYDTSYATTVNISSPDTIIARFKLKTATHDINGYENQLALNAFPSPFSDVLNIDYTIKDKAPVRISLFNAYGTEVTELYNSNGTVSPASYKLTVNPEEHQLASGLYFVKVFSGNATGTKKVIYIKK